MFGFQITTINKSCHLLAFQDHILLLLVNLNIACHIQNCGLRVINGFF